MTREGIKAVRFCMGHKTDLRVKLYSDFPGTAPYKESIAKFLEKLGLPPVNPKKDDGGSNND